MKFTPFFVAGFILVGLSTTFAKAQSVIYAPVSVSATCSVQNLNATISGAIYRIPAYIKYTLTTKTLMVALAKNEFAKGNYSYATFPTGAKLVLVIDRSGNNLFQVVDKADNLIVDVSDLLSLQLQAGIYFQTISFGSLNFSTPPPLAAPSKASTTIATFIYNGDPFVVAIPNSLSLTGLLTTTITDGRPNINTGSYRESQTLKLTTACGDGLYQDNPMMVTGTLTISGSGTLGAP